jgi:AAA+ ATPase superfamily predicted ATPase
MSKIIGRLTEIRLLQQSLISEKSELIAIYGRRRVGKTFLVRNFFQQQIVFEISGLHKGNMFDQLQNFNKELNQSFKKAHFETPSSWMEAFSQLEQCLNQMRSKKKKVIFLDEFPWMATPRSKFLMAFENFWNSYCTKREDLIGVICGSAASYMIKNIVKNKGGLHNRISQKIKLLPFNLYETHQFLKSRGIHYTKYDLAQLYMAIGGVPHYLEKVQKGMSVAQNIDYICFEKDGVLRSEFDILFHSLFENSEKHLTLVKTLAKVNKGITRQELLQQTGLQSGGDLSLKLEELIESGFVSEYNYLDNKKQLTLYRLSDEYSRFYLRFIENNKNLGVGTWQRLHTSTTYKSWVGFSFETLCLKHIKQIKKSLGIEAIYSTNSSWFNREAQIDLVINRDDNIINLCELKFYNSPFSIDKKYYQELLHKKQAFQEETHTSKNVFITFISTFGLKENPYSKEIIQNELKIDDLFTE